MEKILVYKRSDPCKVLFFIERDLAETSFDLIQIVSYGIITNNKNVLLYVRKGDDKRLDDLYSIGFGRHVNECDCDGVGKDVLTVSYKCLLRELEEEIGLTQTDIIQSQYLYSIELNNTDIDKMHIGFVFKVDIKSDFELSGEKQFYCNFINVDKLKHLSKIGLIDLESWSRYILLGY